MGIMIGSAIFIVPAQITSEMGSQGWALAVWLVAGLLSLFGALSFAELAAMFPRAGGQYVYLREAYGPLVSYLCGWTFFLSVQTGSISTVAVGFAQYLADLVAVSPWQQKAWASGIILVLTAINYRGVREGGTVQSVLTALKVGAMVVLVILGFALVDGSPVRGTSLPVRSGFEFVSYFGVAMVAALWAYDGWNNVTFAAGEVRQAERNVPLALVLGTTAVIVVYLALNLVYYHVLPLHQIVRSTRVAADAAVQLFGRVGSRAVTVAILVSMLGSVNGMILAGARVYYAMAQDGLFFRGCGRIHPRFRTPHWALVLQAGWAIFLVALGSYEQLFTYVIFAAWIFYALTAFAVILLRRKRPDVERPYRVSAYPFVPIIFVLTAVGFITNTLLERPIEAGIGGLIVALGIPVYFIWGRKRWRPLASRG